MPKCVCVCLVRVRVRIVLHVAERGLQLLSELAA